jgi:hypothetical protein
MTQNAMVLARGECGGKNQDPPQNKLIQCQAGEEHRRFNGKCGQALNLLFLYSGGFTD